MHSGTPLLLMLKLLGVVTQLEWTDSKVATLPLEDKDVGGLKQNVTSVGTSCIIANSLQPGALADPVL